MTRPTVMTPADVAIESKDPARPSPRAAAAARPQARERQGKRLVVTGWITAVVGIVLYCAASFAGGADADLGAVLFHGAIPAARAALLVVGAGTLLWIVGSVVHTNAVLDGADGEPVHGDERAGRRS